MASTGAKLVLSGADELQKLLRELPKRVVKKGLRQAMTAASTPIAKAARAGAAKESGTLKKAITKKIKSYSSGNVVALVGANKGKAGGEYMGRRRVPANYLHLVERGTQPHTITTEKGAQIQHPGSQGKHFLHTAYDSQKGAALGIAEAKLLAVLTAEAAKLAVKGKGK